MSNSTTYRGIAILMDEAHGFTVRNNGEYTVNGSGLTYKASSAYGNSFAMTAQEAFNGAKAIIDNALNQQQPSNQQ